MSEIKRNDFISEATDSSKSVFKQTVLNIKYIIHNWSQILLLLVFPFTALCLVYFFIPLTMANPIFIFIGVVSPSGIVYISITYNWRESTLFKTQLLTRADKSRFYLSSYITLLIFGMAFLMISFLTILFFGDILPTSFFSQISSINDGEKYMFWKIPFIPYIYVTMLDVTIMFGLLFLLKNIVKEKRVMYMVVLSLIIFDVIFGGAFNNYFGTQMSTMNDGVDSIPVYRNYSLFPTSLYWPTLILFPFFAPAMQLSALGLKLVYELDPSTGEFVNSYMLSDNYRFWILTYQSEWNILWITPYIWISLFGVSGIIIGR